MQCSRILANNSDSFPGFKSKTDVSTIFVEVDKHVLLLKRSHKEDQPDTWCIPGGKKEGEEKPLEVLLRELKEETQIDLSQSHVEYYGHRYARIPGWDYLLHLFRINLQQRPTVVISSKEHSEYKWVSIYAIKFFPLIKGQDEAFDIVYQKHIWQKVIPEASLKLQKTNDVASLVLKKDSKVLLFTENKRFILNLIGTSGSGKGTQGDFLTKLFGIPNISAGDIFREEFRKESYLGKMIQVFDQNHFPAYLPDEIPIGIMAKRLSGEDCHLGFILDGFPRTFAQTEVTTKVFLNVHDLHVPLFMDVDEASIWARLPGRSICKECGYQVRKFDENPWPGFCPKEAEKGKMVALEKRVEDVEIPKIERRLTMFRENKEVIVKGLEKRDKVASFKLNNDTPPSEVLHLLVDTIQERLDLFYDAEQASKN